MPTYTNNSGHSIYTLNPQLLVAGSEFFRPGQTVQTLQLLDDLPDVLRSADTPYTVVGPQVINADATLSEWGYLPPGSYVLTLGGDWQGNVTVQRAKEADGSDAVLAGEFSSDDLLLVRPLTEITGAYYRYGFLAGGLTSGSLNGNIEVG
jgi:hypothetical protein